MSQWKQFDLTQNVLFLCSAAVGYCILEPTNTISNGTCSRLKKSLYNSIAMSVSLCCAFNLYEVYATGSHGKTFDYN